MDRLAGAVIDKLDPQQDGRLEDFPGAGAPTPRVFAASPALEAAMRAPQIMQGPAIFAEDIADVAAPLDRVRFDDLDYPLPEVA